MKHGLISAVLLGWMSLASASSPASAAGARGPSGASVQALDERDEDATLLAAIVSLGHALDMDVVAKGIQTPRQRIHAEQLDCDQLQGHQTGRPASAEQFTRLYGSH